MNEDNSSVERESYQQIDYVVKEGPSRKRSPLRRLGCAVLVGVWFLILLLPLVMFVLAVQGDITIARFDDVPDSQEHPLFQVRLVMETDFRGLGITNTSVYTEDDARLCVQTNVRFLLWEGDGEPATFCDCYSRLDAESEWAFESTAMVGCE